MASSILEVESLVECLKPTFDLGELGSPDWLRQHAVMEKLNVQAALEAQKNGDESLKELLVDRGKLPLFIHELIAVRLWKDKVRKQLILSQARSQEMALTSIVIPYVICHHELTLWTLLETVLYHSDAVEALGDAVIDVADTVVEAASMLLAGSPPETDEDVSSDCDPTCDEKDDATSVSMWKELMSKRRKIDFDSGIKALSILRYLSSTLKTLPLGVARRLVTTHDVPMLLVELLDRKPWQRQNRKQNTDEVYDAGTWTKLDADSSPLSKVELQIWITLVQLLLDPKVSVHYDFSSYKREQLNRLRDHLTRRVFDQLPILEELDRFLSHLQFVNPSQPKSAVILEVVPEIKRTILKTANWENIFTLQCQRVFRPSPDALTSASRLISEAYPLEDLEMRCPGKPRCGNCGKEAPHRYVIEDFCVGVRAAKWNGTAAHNVKLIIGDSIEMPVYL
ncbi:unnamed protein product [Cyprideis torosa]|uniref:Uncharacterized protein n=1 Tax=Cyprideis torosa TaxID=163714 RepID=A0A7R8ZJH1_9CRUS|nr:unnamed protein product [Cyprideis torosa]CAG0882253.1 unnamed protein product [Cyprideis torosa]